MNHQILIYQSERGVESVGIPGSWLSTVDVVLVSGDAEKEKAGDATHYVVSRPFVEAEEDVKRAADIYAKIAALPPLPRLTHHAPGAVLRPDCCAAHGKEWDRRNKGEFAGNRMIQGIVNL